MEKLGYVQNSYFDVLSCVHLFSCFGCEITGEGLPKLVKLFEVTEVFRGIQ